MPCSPEIAEEPVFGAVWAKLASNGTELAEFRLGGDATRSIVYDLVNSGGDVIIAGSFTGTINFGDGPITRDQRAAFVAKYDGGGKLSWHRVLDLGGHPGKLSISTLPEGSVAVVGGFQDGADLGWGRWTTTLAEELFVLSISREGAPQWSLRGNCASHATAVAAAPSGVFIGAGYAGDCSLMKGEHTSGGGGLVAVVDATGRPQWQRRTEGLVRGVAATAGRLSALTQTATAIAVSSFSSTGVDAGKPWQTEASSDVAPYALASGHSALVVAGAFAGRWNVDGTMLEGGEAAGFAIALRDD